MKIDLYTKAVLTVIAVSLSVIAFRSIDVVPEANAQGSGFPKPIDVNVISVCGSRITPNYDGSLNVKVTNTPVVKLNMPYNGGLDVRVTNPVKIDVPYSGLDVRVTNMK